LLNQCGFVDVAFKVHPNRKTLTNLKPKTNPNPNLQMTLEKTLENVKK